MLDAASHPQTEPRLARDPASHRILTGDRPTGPLHVGHYFGTLENRVRLQRLGVELLVLIADYQAITDRDSPEHLPADVEGLVLDYLAAGIDPDRAVIFTHSQIAELNQLVLPFLSLVTVSELRRNPTVKDEIAAGGGTTSALMFAYPVHQAADILFCHANLVPVGRDQLPHLELTRTIARRFNERYSPRAPYFPEPEALLSRAPLLLGLDGRTKMGKSAGNAIALRATADETAALVRRARTDAERRIEYDPVRRPEVSNLVLLAALCRGEAPEAIAAEAGDRGASALKAIVTEAVNERLAPIRSRRDELVRDRAFLRAVLRDGNERARAIAADTPATVRALMHTDY